LITELSALGVRSPSKLVDKVFAAHGAKFNSSVMALASEVISKPVEVRNQLAETLDSTNYVDTPVEDAEEDEDFEDEQTSVTARLNGSGHRITASSKPAAKSKEVAGQSRMKAILSQTGGSLFSR
jgi:hypothetical protein